MNISINKIPFKSYNKVNNIYYNKKCQIEKYGNHAFIEHKLCSEQFHFDIYNFFKNKPCFKIIEIGSLNNYRTRILTNIFSTLYAVNNSIEMKFYKHLNKDVNNIEYCMLDLYKDKWNTLPENVEVSFINSNNSYENCKSNIQNSLKHFKKLEYIIFDDYGTHEGANKIINELIKNKTFIVEKYIGVNISGINENANEGIICRINDDKELDNNKESNDIKRVKSIKLHNGNQNVIMKQTIPIKKFNVLNFNMLKN